MSSKQRTSKGQPIHGWVILDKPAGVSSAKAVAIVRRVLNASKAGHGGTLDPLASGILPIALGEATKTVSYVMASTKAYRFTVKWGAETTTDDREGTISRHSDVMPDAAAIKAILPQFTGSISQVPPAYSAVKIGGKRAYALARQADAQDAAEKRPELEPRQIDIFSLELEEARSDSADFYVSTGKGAYIRSLARDIARALGSAGHVTALRRTEVGKFNETQAISLDFLDDLGDSAAALPYVMPVLTALDDIPALAITTEEAVRLRHGQAISSHAAPSRETLSEAEEQEPILRDNLADDETAIAVLGSQPVAFIKQSDKGLVPIRVLNL